MTNKPPVYNQTLPVHYDEDEINLVDLWLVLVKRKLILVGVVVASAVAALLYVVVVPPSYQYSTSIEIGTRLNGTELSIVESPETVLAKVKESYIPLAQQNYLNNHSEFKSVVKIDAHIPKGSQIIVLTSKGSEEKSDIHMTLQQSVVDMLKKDHSRIFGGLRKEMEIMLNLATEKLERLKEDSNVFTLEERDTGLTKEDRKITTKKIISEPETLALMMKNNNIQKSRELLAENKLAQDVQRDTIARLEIQQANLRETRALLPPMRSPEPAGPGKTLIILLSLVLGLMLGVFAAFFAEFLSKVRGQTKSLQNA